uniref:Large ribosomal subunit protein mL43 n=1 Tax=Theileria annulata TaxID=5874 RepID=A0A3B0N6R5_THEAN
MSTNGIWQLKSIVLRYSETGHSSRGLRYYLRNLLHVFQIKNPQIDISVNHEQYELPLATFRDGSKYEISLKDLEARHIDEILQFHRNSSGRMEYMKHGQSGVWTTNRSIQGLWKPTFSSQMNALSWFKRLSASKSPYRLKTLPKYSSKSLNLCCEAVKDNGRWGDESIFPKGWDQNYLKQIFCHPFLNDSLNNL